MTDAKGTGMIPLFTYVPVADREALQTLAREAGFSMSHYLRHLVRQHLAQSD